MGIDGDEVGGHSGFRGRIPKRLLEVVSHRFLNESLREGTPKVLYFLYFMRVPLGSLLFNPDEIVTPEEKYTLLSFKKGEKVDPWFI